VLEAAQDINAQMPAYVAARIADALNEAGKPVKGASILVLGVAYKADVGDARETPAIGVLQQLRRRGAKVRFHDPYIESVQINGAGLERAELTHSAITGADCVVLLTPHRRYDLEWIVEHSTLVFDARNAYARDNPKVVRL